ncbi:protein patched homolog 1-like isoform X2 [Anneissia japonica]|uniref:protein patched homolog 1-like isoform X2 n=1 Tax=Anneissia japonica TaxID=1529436 RepID=UPI0014255CC8|nr:protein patched homolog 1-like isoform X2 [Anneissia japonica]
MERWARPATRESQDSLPPRMPQDCCYEDLLTKTSWCNAEYAYREIDRGRAEGNKLALWWRAKIQSMLFCIGCYLHLHSGKVLFLGALFLVVCGIGMKLAKMETNVEKLWVEEGGRLERELKYTSDTLQGGERSASQVIIQSPKYKETNILTQENIQLHLNASLLATQVTVDMFDIPWTLKDVCFVEKFPAFETIVDIIFEQLMPCTIITPLDCFWEGSKILGPDEPVFIQGMTPEPLVWSNTDPYKLVNQSSVSGYFPENIKNMIDASGIGHGYQDRPCLNPYDPDCPSKAPNKISKEIPDFTTLMTGGCSGYAKSYMKWPEELIMGGIKKNASGHIQSAEALETIFLLNSKKNMYDNLINHPRVSHIKWTEEKAEAVLDAWQKEFTKAVRKSAAEHPTQDVNAFSEASMNEVLTEFSETSLPNVVGGYMLMVLYAFLTMVKLCDGVKSQGAVGLFGVLLISGTVVASLGFCAFIGIKFNASTTQVLPFLALGLGVDDMFLLAHSSASLPKEIPTLIKTGELLKRTGVCVFMTSLTNMSAFLLAAIIPIPALRSLCFQFAIIVIFNFLSVILIFPAILALDLERRDSKRVDIFCCFKSSSANRVVTIQPSPISDSPDLNSNRRHQNPMETHITLHSTVETVTHLRDDMSDQCVTVVEPSTTMTCTTTPDVRDCANMQTGVRSSSTRTLLRQDSVNQHVTCWRDNRKKFKCWKWSLSGFVKNYYAPFLMNKFVKGVVLLTFAGFLSASVFGILRVEDGLDLTDVVPSGTREQDFLQARLKYFSFYNMYAVTMEDFDYPNNQKLLSEYHKEFQNIPEIIKNADGSLPKFWLDYFREWLLDIQAAFDIEKANGNLLPDKCLHAASDKGMIGYNLIIQTGEVTRPINTDLFYTGRLVDSEGIINPKGFYNYLTAWINIDSMSFEVSQGALHPSVQSIAPNTLEKMCRANVARAKQLNFTQMPFYVHNIYTTEDFVRLIKDMRNISDHFTAMGLPNYPSGIPFTFWEQYIKLRYYLMLSLVCVFAAIFVVISMLLFNLWAAFLLVLVLVMITVELFGVMGFIGVKMSAIPAVTLIISVGIGVEFTVHTLYAFLTSIGDRDRRISMALVSTFTPVVDGGISTFLGVALLARSDFEIVVMYFFEVLAALVVIGLLNGLVLFPVLLSIIGPEAEVRPLHQATRLSTPSPPPSPVQEHSYITRQYDRSYDRRRDFTRMSVSGMRDNRRRQMREEHIEILPPEVVVERSLPKDYKTRRSTRRHSHRRSQRPHRDSRSFNPAMHSAPRHETTVTTTARVRIIHGCVSDIENQNFYRTGKEDDMKIEELEYPADDGVDSTL